MTTGRIYKVVFKEPPLSDDPRTEFYFSSLSAIFDTFTEEHIGCKVSRLWNIKVSSGVPYNGKRCQITSGEFQRKRQNNPSKGRK